jgi:iron complex outermembrane receptor protein
MRTSFRVTVFSASAVIAAAFLLSVSIVPIARAQQNVERVEITGSSIRRTESETAVPVQVITREEVEKTGSTNVEQFLQGLGVALQGNSNSVAATGSGATTGGVSTVSLRGLGSQRTLVLIDGKRVSGGGTITDSTSVDINMIPLAAIERVEILRDGASAIYGSDAIGGVVNFILRKDYVGAEGSVFGAVTQHGGGEGAGINTLIGWGDMGKQGFNANLIADFRHEEAIFGSQRGFASSGIFPEHLNDTSSGNTFPANFAAADGSFGTRNPTFPNCPGPYSTVSPLFTPPGTPAGRGCRFDPAPLVSLIPKTDTGSLFGNLRMRLTPAIEGYVQGSYVHKEVNTVIQPVPLSDQFALPPNHPLFNVAPYNGSSTFLLTPSSPYYPTAFLASQGLSTTTDLLVRYRSAVTGNRDLTDISNQWRILFGGRGTVFQTWDYDASYLHMETRLSEKVNNGYPILTKILPLLNSGQINPFGPSTLTPAAEAAAETTQFRGEAWSTKTSVDGLQAKVAHDFMRMAGGPLAVALGVEARREGFKVEVAPEIETGDVSGYGGNFLPVSKSRRVGAMFGEVNLPLLKTLELTAAARYDDYSDVGNKVSPILRARFQPVRQVMLRGTIGKGFRAPGLTELYQPQTTGVSAPGLNDPLRCPTTTPSPIDCNTQFPITLGGNTALKPEESLNRTVGIVLEPTTNMSFGVDLWSVDVRNTIVFGVTPAAILADPARFGFLVTRGAPDAACPGCPGPIVNIDQRNLNLGETKVRGVDVDARWRFPSTNIGAFTLSFNGTYIDKYEFQSVDGTWQSINGMVSPIVNGAGGVIPRWRHFLSLGWRRNAWDVTLMQQYQRGYQDIPGTFEDTTDPTATLNHHVGDYTLYHLYTSYTGFYSKNLKLTFAIRNLFDTAPPYTNAGGQNYFQSGYDPGYADPRLRSFILTATYKFK